MDIQKVEWEGIDWINLTQDRDRWRALVNGVMKLRTPKNVGISRLTKDLLAIQEGLCFMKLFSLVS
jgi:hypothetical protein